MFQALLIEKGVDETSRASVCLLEQTINRPFTVIVTFTTIQDAHLSFSTHTSAVNRVSVQSSTKCSPPFDNVYLMSQEWNDLRIVGIFFRIYSAYYYLSLPFISNIFRPSPLTMNLNVKSAASLSRPIQLRSIVSLTFVNSALFLPIIKTRLYLFFFFFSLDLSDIRRNVPGEPGVDYPAYTTLPQTGFTCEERSRGKLSVFVKLWLFFSFYLNVSTLQLFELK